MKLKRFYQKHGGYYYVTPDRRWIHLGRDRDGAIQRYLELVKPVPTVTLSTVFDRYEKEVIPTKAALTQRDNRSELKNLRGVFGKLDPNVVEPVHIYAYMDARAKSSKVRANREKALLSHVYSYAIRWGLAKHNPCRDVQSFKEKPHDRYVTDDEFWRVHDAAPAGVRKAMCIAVSTGLRLSDVLALTRRHCTSDGLLVRPSKTARSSGKKLLFVWTPELRALVDYPAGDERPADDTPLVVGERGHGYTRSGFQTVWRRVMIEVFPDKEDRFSFHDLRRKAGSDSKDGKLLGHADSRVLNRHYRVKPEEVTPINVTR